MEIKDYTYIGKSVPLVDAREKVTGEAIYSSDISLPGMHYGKCKRSPYPFAKIKTIDISKALSLPGVSAVITAKNIKQFHYGEFVMDQYPLCLDYVHYVGDEVAAVSAISEEIALEALDLIKVEYEILEPIFNPEEAIKPGAPQVHPELEPVKNNLAYTIDVNRGDVEKAFKDADLVLEERFETPTQHQCYLQPRDCVAHWVDGNVTLWAANQCPFRFRIPIAKALGIPESNLRIISGNVGGGFGNNATRLWPITALLSKASGKPVKIVLTREEEFIAGRPFASSVVYLKMGFTKDGTIVAKEQKMIMDSGAYTGSNKGLLTVASLRCDNLYRIENIKSSGYLVYTNSIPRGSLRSVGNYLGHFIQESMLDRAAERLKIDPIDLRLKNASQKGDTTVHGFTLNSCGLSESLKKVREESEWDRKKKEKRKFHGLGVACGVHVTGNRSYIPVFEGSSAIVRVDDQGVVSVISGEQEIGQGSKTIFAQIAAEELGVPIDKIRVLPVDTQSSPFAKGTFGSRVTAMGGAAVRDAAIKARKELLTAASRALGKDYQDLDLRGGNYYLKGSGEILASFEEMAQRVVLMNSGLPIMGLGSYNVPAWVNGGSLKESFYGNYSVAYTFVTQVAEVDINPDTGQVSVLEYWAAADLGKAINPKACEGQMEGGISMGLGYALKEGYFFNKGTVLNPNFTDYKLFTASSMPRIHTYFIETEDPETIYGAKSIGEAVINPAAPAVVNAICDALGVRITNLPVTPFKILKIIREKKIAGE